MVLVAASIDLAFLLIRIGLVGLGVIGVIAMGPNDPLFVWGILEVVTGSAMIVFGIPADILMLLGKRLGATLGVLALVATASNIVVTLFEIPMQLSNMRANAPVENQQAYIVGAMVGAGFVIFIRLIWNGFYAFAAYRAFNTYR